MAKSSTANKKQPKKTGASVNGKGVEYTSIATKKKATESGADLSKRFEKAPTEIYPTSALASKAVANEIAQLIKSKQILNQPVVLGLATGSTPKGVYRELVRMHKEEKLSFKNVITFNLDEYYPMDAESLHSYVRFMKEQLFDHVDIPKGNWNIPDGTLSPEKIADFCRAYD